MLRFDVKVCGMTRPEDALKAAELGAQMIGLIFYEKSPRYVSLGQAREICEVLDSAIIRVGVFVGENCAAMIEVAQSVGLNRLQVHGDLTDSDIEQIHQAGLSVVQSFHVDSMADYDKVFASMADFVMLDNATKSKPGGTGQSFDWSLKPPRPINRLVLAGGIGEANVEEGVRIYAPEIVDVNSGVENAPGVKSHRKMERFFDVCKRMWRESKA